MQFQLSEDHQLIRQTAADFAKSLKAGVIERDEQATFPTAFVKQMGDLGFMGMMVDPTYSGAGMDALAYVLAIEEISKIDASTGVIMSAHNSLVLFGL